jgi:uncharacterized protein YjbI with pentapeptide repeats
MDANRRFWWFIIACVCLVSLTTPCAEADIVNWQTGETIPGTEEIEPDREMHLFFGWNSENRNLRYADFGGLVLTNALFWQSSLDNARLRKSNLESTVFLHTTLSNADLSGANLTDVRFVETSLTGADLTDSIIAGTDFEYATERGFTDVQLYSTASYKTNDLQGVRLIKNDVSGWDFSGQNL